MKNGILRVLNLALYLAFCAMAGTGFLLAYRLPPGSRGGRGLTALGLDRHQWGDIHLWLSFAVIAGTIVHLLLNRVWLQKIAAARQHWRLLSGLALGAVFVAVFFVVPVERQSDQEHGSVEDPALEEAILFGEELEPRGRGEAGKGRGFGWGRGRSE